MSQAPHPPDVPSLLRAEHAVAEVLAGNPPREAAIAALLPAIGAALGWAAAALWEPAGQDASHLVCRQTWSDAAIDGADWELACRATAIPAGEGLPGRALAERRPGCLEALPEGSPRTVAATRAGLRFACAFPLLGTDAPVGAIEGLSPAPVRAGDELLATLASLGGRIGRHLE